MHEHRLQVGGSTKHIRRTRTPTRVRAHTHAHINIYDEDVDGGKDGSRDYQNDDYEDGSGYEGNDVDDTDDNADYDD